jgi:hypothetical protein
VALVMAPMLGNMNPVGLFGSILGL